MRSCIICQMPLDFVNEDSREWFTQSEFYCYNCGISNYVRYEHHGEEYNEISQYVEINGKQIEDGQEAAKQLMLHRMKE